MERKKTEILTESDNEYIAEDALFLSQKQLKKQTTEHEHEHEHLQKPLQRRTTDLIDPINNIINNNNNNNNNNLKDINYKISLNQFHNNNQNIWDKCMKDIEIGYTQLREIAASFGLDDGILNLFQTVDFSMPKKQYIRTDEEQAVHFHIISENQKNNIICANMLTPYMAPYTIYLTKRQLQLFTDMQYEVKNTDREEDQVTKTESSSEDQPLFSTAQSEHHNSDNNTAPKSQESIDRSNSGYPFSETFATSNHKNKNQINNTVQTNNTNNQTQNISLHNNTDKSNSTKENTTSGLMHTKVDSSTKNTDESMTDRMPDRTKTEYIEPEEIDEMEDLAAQYKAQQQVIQKQKETPEKKSSSMMTTIEKTPPINDSEDEPTSDDEKAHYLPTTNRGQHEKKELDTQHELKSKSRYDDESLHKRDTSKNIPYSSESIKKEEEKENEKERMQKKMREEENKKKQAKEKEEKEKKEKEKKKIEEEKKKTALMIYVAMIVTVLIGIVMMYNWEQILDQIFP